MTEGEALVAEALRLNQRYLDEVVVGWRLCPWAERALATGQVMRWALLDEAPDAPAVVGCLDAMAAAPDAAIGLVIFPRAALAFGAFHAFAERVRRAARPRPFLIAAFHPEAPASFDTSPALTAFVRRTPDPTLQLVRGSVMEGLGPDVSAAVGRQNFAAVSARGAAALDALVRDIRRDRDESYARLGV